MTVFDLPLALVGPGLLLVLMIFSLGGLHVFRVYWMPRLRFDDAAILFSAAMISSIMVFYGLALALIAVHVWETFETAAKITSREATTLAALYRDVSEYPEPSRTVLRNGIRDYVDQVIHDAWPKQRRGVVPLAGVAHMDRIQATLMAFEPHSVREQLLASETLGAYNQMIEARRMRVDSVDWHLPGVMWMVIMLGAVTSFLATFFFPVQDERIHRTLVALLAVFIGGVIFMVVALDWPYRGDLGLPSTPYQIIYDQLMKR